MKGRPVTIGARERPREVRSLVGPQGGGDVHVQLVAHSGVRGRVDDEVILQVTYSM